MFTDLMLIQPNDYVKISANQSGGTVPMLDKNEIASVFCFQDEQEMLKAWDAVAEKLRGRVEKRVSNSEVTYPYIIVCAERDNSTIRTLIASAKVRPDDNENPFYWGVLRDTQPHGK